MAQLLFCRATALEGLGRTNEAAACIDAFVTQHQEQAEVLSIAAQLYLQSMQYQPALAVLDRLLDREPQNPELLSNKGLAEMQLTRYDAAITTLTTALFLAPSNQVVRLNRAIACLRAGQLEAAYADYQQLLGLPELLQGPVRPRRDRLAPAGHQRRHPVLSGVSGPWQPWPRPTKSTVADRLKQLRSQGELSGRPFSAAAWTRLA